MKTTLIQKPNFTWEGNNLFCGKIFLGRLTQYDQSADHEFFWLEHAALPEAATEAGWDDWWNSKPFDIKANNIGSAHDLVETIYRKVFDCFDFETTVQ